MKLNIQEIGISEYYWLIMSKNGGDMRWWKVGVMTDTSILHHYFVS
jgi:hypothetical protein